MYVRGALQVNTVRRVGKGFLRFVPIFDWNWMLQPRVALIRYVSSEKIP